MGNVEWSPEITQHLEEIRYWKLAQKICKEGKLAPKFSLELHPARTSQRWITSPVEVRENLQQANQRWKALKAEASNSRNSFMEKLAEA